MRDLTKGLCFPGIAALSMTIGTFSLEGTNVLPLGTRSIVGYLNGTAILPVLWLAIVPGIIGHQVSLFPFLASCPGAILTVPCVYPIPPMDIFRTFVTVCPWLHC